MNSSIDALLKAPLVTSALEKIESDAGRTLAEQIELCAIRSPSKMEQQRAARYLEMFREVGLDDVHLDDVGNVHGIIYGTGGGPTVMIAGHMDTVFGPEIDCTPTVRDGIIYAPGITDDTRGMAEVLAIARAMKSTGLRARGNIRFCGNVDEEGGMTGSAFIFDNPNDIDGFISIDGTFPELLTTRSLGNYFYRVTYRTAGGHAFLKFGLPSANNAAGRAIAKIAEIRTPASPKTIFNVGVVRGGVAVNGISAEAVIEIDMRSPDNDLLDELRDRILGYCRLAAAEEEARWLTESVSVEIECFDACRGCSQDQYGPMVQAAIAAYRAFGLEPSIPEGASTDANQALRNNVPALAVGRGGTGAHSHTVHEQFDPTDAHKSVQRNLILLMTLCGVEGVCEATLPVREK